MAEFTFYGWTAADLGMASIFDLFSGGPFTVVGLPDNITVSDGPGDTSFDDAPSEPTPDPLGDQQAFGDIILDGAVVIPSGGSVWNIGEFTVTNATSGEVGTLIVFGDTAGNPIGMSSSIELSIGDSLTYSNFVINGAEDFDNLICFCGGTQIDAGGESIPIENLSVGDRVRTSSNGDQKIRWIGRRFLTKWHLFENPKLRPVRISAGALGNGLPTKDLLVSRQHRMLIGSRVAQRMFGEKEVLVSAINLTKLPGVYVDYKIEKVAYFHLLFDQHEVIFAEGAPTESLFTGPEALKSVSDDAKEEILTLFPELAMSQFVFRAAQYIPSGVRQKKLIERHLRNNREFLRL